MKIGYKKINYNAHVNNVSPSGGLMAKSVISTSSNVYFVVF